MHLTQWIDKCNLEYWTFDSKGSPSKMIYGARRNVKSPYIQPDFVIERSVRNIDWVKEHYSDSKWYVKEGHKFHYFYHSKINRIAFGSDPTIK